MTDLRIDPYNHRLWVQCTQEQGDQLVAAYCLDYYRSFIHPLYTPAGVQVLENGPSDHPHHQGISYGHDEVNGHDFWSAGSYGWPGNRQTIERGGRLEHRVADGVALFDQVNVWRTEGGARVVREHRLVAVRPDPRGTVVDWVSVLEACYGPVVLATTKEGGIAVRRHHQLEARFGGVIVDSEGRETEKNIFDQDAEWVAFQGAIGGHPIGIALFPHPAAERCPWFVRDYGLATINPRRQRPAQLGFGEKHFLGARIVAFDGTTSSAGVADLYREYLAAPPQPSW
ncbi:MAG: PmoA family protein [Chloroflexi bacterium]|nr:PmoA family protein [Chloroflexota bacterium]